MAKSKVRMLWVLGRRFWPSVAGQVLFTAKEAGDVSTLLNVKN
jgi:hypothetical protein